MVSTAHCFHDITVPVVISCWKLPVAHKSAENCPDSSHLVLTLISLCSVSAYLGPLDHEDDENCLSVLRKTLTECGFQPLRSTE
jgi:hypothetical protein